VVDVQTHLVRPSRITTDSAAALLGFLRMVEPERWRDPIDPELLSAPAWASCVFAGSETSVALLTSPPGLDGAGVIDNADIAAAREVVDRYAGTGRVLTHAIVHPNAGPDELERMGEWSTRLRPAGWKVYTLWDPPGGPTGGWYLDDDVGAAFLDRVRELGPRIVCAHKGLAGPVPSLAPAAASPRDIGPVAVAYPDIDFVVYHSGYDIDPGHEEGAHDADPQRGVSRLVSSLATAGVKPGANVWAELGSTWSLILRRPEEAAHVLGKLLLAVGEDRILWGTDSVWYGPPQPLIDAFRRGLSRGLTASRHLHFPPLGRALRTEHREGVAGDERDEEHPSARTGDPRRGRGRRARGAAASLESHGGDRRSVDPR